MPQEAMREIIHRQVCRVLDEVVRIRHALHQTPEPAGAVRLIFQPAEETGAGAKAMIAAGALGPVALSAVFALHGWPKLATGKIAVLAGLALRAAAAAKME